MLVEGSNQTSHLFLRIYWCYINHCSIIFNYLVMWRPTHETFNNFGIPKFPSKSPEIPRFRVVPWEFGAFQAEKALCDQKPKTQSLELQELLREQYRVL
jgi:hypothetical protein